MKKVYKNPEREKAYRIFLYILFAAGVCGIFFFAYCFFWLQVPNQIRIYSGSTQNLTFHVPASGELYYKPPEAEAVAVSDSKAVIHKTESAESVHVLLDRPITLTAGEKKDSYVLNLRLLGFIPFKQMNIQVVEDTSVIPAGIPIGIYVRTKGVLVIGTGEFTGSEGQVCAPCKNLLKPGDYILQADGKDVAGKAAFMQTVQEYGDREMVLCIKRGEETFDVAAVPEKTKGGDYKLGIWIRDNAQGVGTLTYVAADGEFGALGHGINDVDTGALMDVSGGSLYQTEIVGIRKGKNGTPGELTGVIDYNPKNQMGGIDANTQEGIFGTCNETLWNHIAGHPIPVGLKQEIKPGPAQILCSVDGETNYYDVEITEIHLENDSVNRGIVLKITDEELLGMTGGIVQGMSGSPIIQDGRLIGAVTHVLVQEPTKGYGIFIERMLSEQAMPES